MFNCQKKSQKHILKALDRSMARIEFTPEGIILDANENFLAVMGYSLNEIKGQHHKMFADPEFTKSNEYKYFWERLQSGEFFSAQYQRLAKGGREVWIEATYNPVYDDKGRLYKVIKYASDITEKSLETAHLKGKIEAIERSQARIEFTPEGIILDANKNFLNAVGYTLDEIKGQHHSMFAVPGFSETDEYKDFWKRLKSGEFFSAQYKRVAKGGREIWIEATYNPIFDGNNAVIGVVKFATDITERKNRNAQLAQNFQTNIGDLVDNVANYVVEMKSLSTSLSATAEETSVQSKAVSSSASELERSVGGIKNQVITSSKIVDNAKEETKNSEKMVSSLLDASKSIDEVTHLISDIAEQTNLLALNATIEAARAGEAGKGFAVVAAEVKKLAQETSAATDSISKHVANIQNVSNSTANVIKNIARVIEEISTMTNNISTELENQSLATQEVSSSITHVESAAKDTSNSSTSLSNTCEKLSSQSTDLQSKVDAFLNDVKSM